MSFLSNRFITLGVASLFFFLSVLLVAPQKNARAEIGQEAKAAQKDMPCTFDSLLKERASLEARITSEKSEAKLPALIAEQITLEKEIFSDVIACAILDAQSLHRSITALQILDREGKELQGQFINELDDAVTYYEKIRASVNDLDKEGIQTSARVLKKWRDAHYYPLANRTAYFMAWTKNQELLERARSRLSYARQTILSLKLAQNEGVQNVFGRTQTLLLRSEESHRRAQQSLTRKESPSVSLGHMKTSLDELYRMYSALYELGAAIQRTRTK